MKRLIKPNYCFTVISLFLAFWVVTSISYAQTEYISPEETQDYIGKVKTVCGTVASTKYAIRSRGQPTFLNLNQPYPHHVFTVLIWGSHRNIFRNPPEVFYKGKRICATGVITAYRGRPQIVIRELSQIKIKAETSSPRTINDTYHQRYTSDERRVLKGILALFGYNLDCDSDNWDKRTGQAVRNFQANKNLTPDGKIGPKTLKEMLNSIIELPNLKYKDKLWIQNVLSVMALKKELKALNTKESAIYKPTYYPSYRYYRNSNKIEIGNEVEFYDYELGEYKYGDVEDISGGEVEVYNYEDSKYYYVDIADVE